MKNEKLIHKKMTFCFPSHTSFSFFFKNKIKHGDKYEYSSHIFYISTANMKIIHQKRDSKIKGFKKLTELAFSRSQEKSVANQTQNPTLHFTEAKTWSRT